MDYAKLCCTVASKFLHKKDVTIMRPFIKKKTFKNLSAPKHVNYIPGFCTGSLTCLLKYSASEFLIFAHKNKNKTKNIHETNIQFLYFCI